MLNDWSGVDVPRAITFISSCRVRYLCSPYDRLSYFFRLMKGDMARRRSVKHKVRACVVFGERRGHIFETGGTTYTALASLYLAPCYSQLSPLTTQERQATIHWLVQNQDNSGGFCGRTNKEPDACYCFWCGASLQVCDFKK